MTSYVVASLKRRWPMFAAGGLAGAAVASVVSLYTHWGFIALGHSRVAPRG